jgi:CRP-like cAMP-binding protein
MRQILFEAGQTIFSEGEPSTYTYRIVAGSVDIVVRGRESPERRIASLGPDEVFGEMGIIDPAPRSATAVAREPTACVAYTAEEVIELMSSDPAQAIALLQSLIIRLRTANRKLMAKAPPGPPQRPGGS